MNRENKPRVFAHYPLMIWFVAGAAALLLSCHTAPRSTTAEFPGLRGKSYTSLEKLAKATVKALNDSSKAKLNELRVSREEYEHVTWVRVPSELHANVTVDMAWEWVERDSKVAARRALNDFGCRGLRFDSVYVLDGVMEFPLIRIHRDVRIVATDRAGEVHDFKLLNVVAEVEGRFKVLAFDS